MRLHVARAAAPASRRSRGGAGDAARLLDSRSSYETAFAPAGWSGVPVGDRLREQTPWWLQHEEECSRRRSCQGALLARFIARGSEPCIKTRWRGRWGENLHLRAWGQAHGSDQPTGALQVPAAVHPSNFPFVSEDFIRTPAPAGADGTWRHKSPAIRHYPLLSLNVRITLTRRHSDYKAGDLPPERRRRA